jgi:hypothetical protein
MMLTAAVLFSAALVQAPAAPTDCTVALTRGITGVTTQVCLAEAELGRAQTLAKDSADWKRRMESAVTLYKKAMTLPADDSVKLAIVERLLVLFDRQMLNDETEMLAAFQELMTLQPREAGPLLRLAKYQESRGAVDAAEEALLSARRLRPDEIEPLQMLAQFYSRRAGALHATIVKQEEREPTPPGHARQGWHLPRR